MESLLTENKSIGYKSKILEASLVIDPKISIVQVDTDAVHEQVAKQLRKRHMINLKPNNVTAYVMNQVKVTQARENKKQEQEIARQQKQNIQKGQSYGQILSVMAKKINDEAQQNFQKVIEKTSKGGDAVARGEVSRTTGEVITEDANEDAAKTDN